MMREKITQEVQVTPPMKIATVVRAKTTSMPINFRLLCQSKWGSSLRNKWLKEENREHRILLRLKRCKVFWIIIKIGKKMKRKKSRKCNLLVVNRSATWGILRSRKTLPYTIFRTQSFLQKFGFVGPTNKAKFVKVDALTQTDEPEEPDFLYSELSAMERDIFISTGYIPQKIKALMLLEQSEILEKDIAYLL